MGELFMEACQEYWEVFPPRDLDLSDTCFMVYKLGPFSPFDLSQRFMSGLECFRF
jgi:hypothetical protein